MNARVWGQLKQIGDTTTKSCEIQTVVGNILVTIGDYFIRKLGFLNWFFRLFSCAIQSLILSKNRIRH